MSDKPNTMAIGAFVTGALLIAITTVIFALGSGFGRDSSTVVMVFEGSVKGLNVGAPVALRGVQIGQVTDIELILNADTVELIMLVEAEIRSENVRRTGTTTESLTEELISRGLRAQLNTQSILTGLLYVQLDFHPDSEINLAPIDSPYLQIPTIPTETGKTHPQAGVHRLRQGRRRPRVYRRWHERIRQQRELPAVARAAETHPGIS